MIHNQDGVFGEFGRRHTRQSKMGRVDNLLNTLV